MPTYFLTKYSVLCICGPRISGFSPQDAARLYNIFYWLSPKVSCLNHIPGFSPEGVSIPTCFTHIHTYFSCHATVSLNLDIEHQHIVDLPYCRTPNTVSTPTMHLHPTRRDVSCINAMQMSLHAISCLHVCYVSHATYILHYMSSVMNKLYLIRIIISIFITHISHNFTYSTCYSIYSNNTH